MPCSSMLPNFPVAYVEGDLLWDEQTKQFKDIINVCVYVPEYEFIPKKREFWPWQTIWQNPPFLRSSKVWRPCELWPWKWLDPSRPLTKNSRVFWLKIPSLKLTYPLKCKLPVLPTFFMFNISFGQHFQPDYPPEVKHSPSKNDGPGRRSFPFGMVYFQGRTVKLPGGYLLHVGNHSLSKIGDYSFDIFW